MFEDVVKDIIWEVFSSKDMRDYLCENVQELAKWQIVDMVGKACIPLVRKAEIFEALAVYENMAEVKVELEQARAEGDTFEENYIMESSYYYQAIAIRRALEAVRIESKEEGVLLMIERERRDGKERIVGNLPFFSCEKMLAFIKQSYDDLAEEDIKASRMWHAVEKYEENAVGDLEEAYDYDVINGEIVYYTCSKSEIGLDMRCDSDLNVPVPFRPGDIIVCDGGPTCDETMAVVLRTGDNIDCCSLVVLCKRDERILEYTPAKHSSMFYDADTHLFVPPLYSARYINEEISEEDEALRKIAQFINGDEDRGYIVERDVVELPMDEVTDELIAWWEMEYREWYREIGSKIRR